MSERGSPANRYRERRAWLDGIKVASGCVDCGLSGPPEALTFDHVRGEKKFNVGQSWNQGRAALEAEIAKCEIVCANCHNVRTKRSAGEWPPFVPFQKVPRLRRRIVVTEKIDGTNAAVWVDGYGDVWAASRNRWLSTESDNFGFAAWVADHESEFADLGPTVIRGEWYGNAIQRGYGMSDRRFAVFSQDIEIPACCERVPVLYDGVFSDRGVNFALNTLREHGSIAAPGFMNPEGVVVYHTAAGTLAKVLLEGDELPKGAVG